MVEGSVIFYLLYVPRARRDPHTENPHLGHMKEMKDAIDPVLAAPGRAQG